MLGVIATGGDRQMMANGCHFPLIVNRADGASKYFAESMGVVIYPTIVLPGVKNLMVITGFERFQ